MREKAEAAARVNEIHTLPRLATHFRAWRLRCADLGCAPKHPISRPDMVVQ